MIAYYAHSHGSGHCNYAQLMAQYHPEKTIVFTDSDFNFDPDISVVHLDNEHCNGEELDVQVFGTPEYLHYAPIGLSKITRRNQQILSEVIKREVSLMIIDVSVEVAALARVSSIPYVYVKMMGNRDDAAHLNAYEGALFLVAYYPESFEPESTPQWIRNKTLYLGFISKFSLQPPLYVSEVPFIKNRFTVVVLQGFGGNQIDDSFVQQLSSQLEMAQIFLVGDIEVNTTMPNVTCVGKVSNTMPYIHGADLLIAACGSNTTAEIITAKKQFLILSEERPYDEQLIFSEALERNEIGIRVQMNNISDCVEKLCALPPLEHTDQYMGSFRTFWNWLDDLNFDLKTIGNKVASHYQKTYSA